MLNDFDCAVCLPTHHTLRLCHENFPHNLFTEQINIVTKNYNQSNENNFFVLFLVLCVCMKIYHTHIKQTTKKTLRTINNVMTSDDLPPIRAHTMNQIPKKPIKRSMPSSTNFIENYHGSNTVFLVGVLMSVVGFVFVTFTLMALCYRSVVVHRNFSLCLRLVERNDKKNHKEKQKKTEN